MLATDYQRLAMLTNKTPVGIRSLDNAVLGLAGEVGEVADLWKKHRYHNQPLDRGKFVLELGDVLWYVAQACESMDIPMGAVMQSNLDKLQARERNGTILADARKRLERGE